MSAQGQTPPTATGGADVMGVVIVLVVVVMIIGAIWGGVSWVWGQVSGDTGHQQAQLEQTWNEAAPSTKQGWCTWAGTGNLTSAGSALVALGANMHGYDLDDTAARELIMDRCGLR